MDWILDLYEQTEHLLAITLIIALMISLCLVYVLRFPKLFYDECYDWTARVMAVVLWFMILCLCIALPLHINLREKSEERKAVQVEQVQQEQLVK